VSVRARGLDHIVLVVADVERSLAWYVERLGAEPVRVEQWRAGEVLFPSVRLSPTTIIDLLAGERGGTNVDHVCIEIEPTDLDALAASGEFDVVGGPAELFGARGTGLGLYVRDPDGNVVELRHYDGRRLDP
jgi:catechol 2,3-dioxygenase-like lactoylglutathione lyase family enzyme